MTYAHKQTNNPQAGFTLVELAIVLVIIGLIVGGVLVGQDLIKSAEVRATISQIEKVNAAATTFRDKHGNLPGDLNNARAAQFGFTPARVAAVGQGDGNNLIEGNNANTAAVIGEPYMFWSDLSAARLIQENLAAPTLLTTPGATANLLPTRGAEGSFVHVYASGGRNFIFIGTPTLAAGVPTINSAGGLSPQQAYTIDTKLDDGLAGTGSIIPVTAIPANTLQPAGANTCVVATGYNTVIANGLQDTPLCDIAIRASF